MGVAVVELDEGGARELLAGAFAYAGAHVEEGLEGGAGGELGGLGFVDLPPEEAVALEAGGVAGFGEAGHECGAKLADGPRGMFAEDGRSSQQLGASAVDAAL